MIKAMSV